MNEYLNIQDAEGYLRDDTPRKRPVGAFLNEANEDDTNLDS
jgi:hypothetical protein